jgi:AraC-like DNA-binding protein
MELSEYFIYKTDKIIMKDRFAIAPGGSLPPPVELCCFWEVFADRSYNVERSPYPPTTQVAILTFGGHGVVKSRTGKNFDLKPGSLFFFHEKDIYHYYCYGDEWNFYWFVFKSYELAEINFEVEQTVKMVGDEQHTVEEILRLLHRDNPYLRRSASAAFSRLLFRWLAENENSSREKYADKIETIIDLLYQHQDGRWTVEKMAARANMSSRNFRRSFIAQTGITPKKYYDNIRLETAYNLLPLNMYSIAQVAEMLGFYSQFHLSKIFKRKYGIPPGRMQQ